MIRPLLFALLVAAPASARSPAEATGDWGVVIERATGSVLIVDRSERAARCRVDGLGDLSHATATFSPDARFAYVFGRDGGLTKLDLPACAIAARVVQADNAIGGAISDDGRVIAVSNYDPGGVRLFDADTLAPLGTVETAGKTVGLADIPGGGFVVADWDAGEALHIDAEDPAAPVATTLGPVGANPYDGLMIGGRTYLVGLFGEKGMAAIDLWADPPAITRVLPDYGRGQPDLPVYKMPHLQGFALAGEAWALPAAGLHQVLWVDARTRAEIGRTVVAGQPVFVTARPDGREVWVNFASPDNGTVQVIDTVTRRVTHNLTPGAGILHIEFAPRGREVWMSARDDDAVLIWDAREHREIARIPARSPSGILFTDRAHRQGL